MSLAWAMSELGDNDEALELFELHLPRYLGIGVRTTAAVFEASYALALVRAGRHDEADAQMSAAWKLVVTYGERWQEPFLLARQADIAEERGADVEVVAQLWQRAADIATAQGSHAVAHRAHAQLERVRAASA